MPFNLIESIHFLISDFLFIIDRDLMPMIPVNAVIDGGYPRIYNASNYGHCYNENLMNAAQ